MRIGIIGAMEQEVTLLRAELTAATSVQHGPLTFYVGQYGEHDIILLQCGIGKVAAAMGTTLLLEHFAPDCVINTGSAGGFDSELSIGDLVLADEVRFHDNDVTAFGYEPGQMAGQPAAFMTHAQLRELAAQAVADVGEVHCKTGLICSGDVFMSDSQRVAAVRQQFPQMAACEMEAAAIGQVCHAYQKPFLVIRALSDIAGQESSQSFDAFLEQAATHSARLVMALVARLQGVTLSA